MATIVVRTTPEDLGFGPCRHMMEALAHPEQIALWAAAFNSHHLDAFTQYTADVQRSLPADRLLTFDATQGWNCCISF